MLFYSVSSSCISICVNRLESSPAVNASACHHFVAGELKDTFVVLVVKEDREQQHRFLPPPKAGGSSNNCKGVNVVEVVSIKHTGSWSVSFAFRATKQRLVLVCYFLFIYLLGVFFLLCAVVFLHFTHALPVFWALRSTSVPPLRSVSGSYFVTLSLPR